MRSIILIITTILLAACETNMKWTGDNLAQRSRSIASMVEQAIPNCPTNTGLAYGACVGRAYDRAITQTGYPRPHGSNLEMRLAVIGEQFDLGNYTEAQTYLALNDGVMAYMAAGGGAALDSAAAKDGAAQAAWAAIAGEMQRQESLNAYRQRTQAWRPHSNASCQGVGQTVNCRSW